MGIYEDLAAAKHEALLARFNDLLKEKHDVIMQKATTNDMHRIYPAPWKAIFFPWAWREKVLCVPIVGGRLPDPYTPYVTSSGRLVQLVVGHMGYIQFCCYMSPRALSSDELEKLIEQLNDL